jgi:tRNA(Ile2) C34 agmatinyltransferase TiaS
MPEEKPVCPECKSELVSEISNFKKCLQCGHQFDLNRDPIGTRARGEKRGLWTKPTPAR